MTTGPAKPTFREMSAGDRLSASDYNRLTRTVGSLTGGNLYDHAKRYSKLRLLRMSEIMGKFALDSSDLSFNREADLQYWKRSTGDVQHTAQVGTHARDNVCDPYNLIYDNDDPVLCFYSEQAGKFFPVNPRTVRHAVTIDTDPTSGVSGVSGSSGFEPDSGDYPAAGDQADTYPVKFVKVRFNKTTGGQRINWTYLDAANPGVPDTYVHNIADATDPGAYIPAGTLLEVYNVTDAWYTHYLVKSETIQFRNDSGEVVPPHGVMRVADYNETLGLFLCEKPDHAEPFQRYYLVNDGEEVAADAIGNGTWLDEADYVLTDGVAAPGELWGAVGGSWKLAKNGYGFEIVGGADTEDLESGESAGSAFDKAMARQSVVVGVIGKTDSEIAKGATGTVKVWLRNPATDEWEESDFEVTARALGSLCPADTYLAVEWKAGEWVCGPMECSDATETTTDNTSSFLFMGA